MKKHGSKMQIINDKGQRLYFTEDDRAALLAAADKATNGLRSFARVLVFTGCRISEALELTAKHIDLSAQVITIRSLKKRNGAMHYRQVPVPPELLDMLDMVHDLRQRKGRARHERLWPWSRMTAWRKLHQLIAEAGIEGEHASAKGLRHGFGVRAVNKGIALNMVQKWLGHADMTTTAIYANASGEEEQAIAARMW
jgi:integrase